MLNKELYLSFSFYKTVLMSAKLLKKESNKVILHLEIELDSKSMLKSENKIQQILNEAGCIATHEALLQFDTDGSSIDVQGKKLTSKGPEKKKYKRHMER